MGLAVGTGLSPTRVRFGSGAAGRPPTEGMYQPTLDGTLTVSRDGKNQIQLLVALPPSQNSAEIDELGIFAADDTLLLHVVIGASSIASGAEVSFPITLNPEVIQ